jgi:hypothetical protein
MIYQELFAFFTVYQALSALKTEAARQVGLDPDRVSFTVTIRTARDHASSPMMTLARTSLEQARQEAVSDLLADRLPPRRHRRYDRVKKPPKNTFETKKRDQPRSSSTAAYKIKIERTKPPPAKTP